MIENFDDKPIIACSSGVGSNVAISLIRLSGFDDFGSIEPLLKISTRKSLGSIEPRVSYLAEIYDQDELIDEVLLTFFKAPNSFTGENLIELGVHGNRLNVERIIDLFCRESHFRRAYGGEFSYRALKNKKLNLSQVEGLDLLLNSNNLFSLKQGFSLLKGELQDQFHELYESYLNHRSSLELSIDFLDDIGEAQADKQLNESFSRLHQVVKALYSRVISEINLLNPEIVFFGPPNAGKSTFFNRLLNKERSIVSSEKGTTRDYVTSTLKIQQNFYELVDTAGIRESSSKIEEEGVRRSFSFLEKAFYKVLMLNPMDIEENEIFLQRVKNYEFDTLILTHSDCDGYSKAENDFLATHKKQWKWFYRTTLSEDQLEFLAQIHDKYLKLIENNPLNLDRHKETIKNIYNGIQEYEKVLKSENDVAIISSELYILGQKIEELLGVISADDVLQNIFNNFCIGK